MICKNEMINMIKCQIGFYIAVPQFDALNPAHELSL